MKKITFRCSGCQQILNIPANINGTIDEKTVCCPNCQQKIIVPEKTQEYRTCPFCAQQILLKAIKCQFCKEFLDENISPKALTQTKQQYNISKNNDSLLSKDIKHPHNTNEFPARDRKWITILFLFFIPFLGWYMLWKNNFFPLKGKSQELLFR